MRFSDIRGGTRSGVSVRGRDAATEMSIYFRSANGYNLASYW